MEKITNVTNPENQQELIEKKRGQSPLIPTENLF